MARIPPAGTSAYKAYLRNSSSGNLFDRLQNVMNGAGNVIQPSVDGNIHPEASANNLGRPSYVPHSETVSGLKPTTITSSKPLVTRKKRTSSASNIYTSSADVGHSGAISAPALDYLNADLAKHYGMNATTAYNEALSNTAYQRAVKDMQAAGLNPAVLFGNGRVSGADGVYGATPLVDDSVGMSSGGSGSSGSGRRSHSSGKLFSTSTYGMISGLGALAGAGIAAATGGSVGLGALTGSNIATSAAKVLNGIFKK